MYIALLAANTRQIFSNGIRIAEHHNTKPYHFRHASAKAFEEPHAESRMTEWSRTCDACGLSLLPKRFELEYTIMDDKCVVERE